MVEKTMKEAMTLENAQRWDKGLPPERKPKQPPPPELSPPKVENLITLKDLKLENVVSVTEGRRNPARNKDGVIFIGFNVGLKMKDGKEIAGWMPEKDFIEMRRTVYRKGEAGLRNVEF